MSDKKMIIRNCPAFDKQYNECHSKIEPHKLYCKDCTDCVLKQIVDYCLDNEKYGDEYYTRPILEKLDIQEVE